MSAQLPAGSAGAAAFAFAYSCISLICSLLLCWLTIVHREGWSYVFLVCISTIVSTVMSLTQQARTILYYRDIMTIQFNHTTHSPLTAELAIANGSLGVDLALYYLQYWSYNVQALLVMFWAGELAQSVYGLSNRPKTRHVLRKVNITGKAVSFLFPALTILLLRVPSIQDNFLGFIMLADLPLMVSLAIGSLLMMAILVRYVKTKKGFTHWAPPSYQTSSNGGGTTSSVAGQTDFSSTQYSSATGVAKKPKSARKQGFHDRWLMVRFTVSFLILAVFEVTNILFQMSSIHNLEKDSKLTQPDLSTERANTTFFLFLPGTTAGIFLFIVFGTTSGCRTKMRETFTPKSWQAARERRRAEKEGIAMAGDLEFNHTGVTTTEEYNVGGSPNGKNRIMRSSSVTVTYQSKNGMEGAVPLESLPAHRRSQYGRKMSFKSADDLLLDSDGELNGDSDKDSTSEMMASTGASPSTDNKNDNTSTSKTSMMTYKESLDKPLPNPNDPPIARIAHFQSITRPQNTHQSSRATRARTGSLPERREDAAMSRHFAEHHRRQISSAASASQTPQQQQQQTTQPQQGAQRTQTLTRQWTHGNSSRQPPVTRGSPAVTSGPQQLGEEYYGSSPEHSDDSGPVLPIMAAKRT